jgi:hypothetical protein
MHGGGHVCSCHFRKWRRLFRSLVSRATMGQHTSLAEQVSDIRLVVND